MTTKAPEYHQNHRTCAYIASIGINPNQVAEDGWDGTGYTYIEGDPPFGDSTRRVRKEWPTGFDYQHMLKLWETDAPSRRRRGDIDRG